jgi:hypothetical protein
MRVEVITLNRPHARVRIGDEPENPPPSSTLSTLGSQLDALAARVARLSPCRRDPERFHIDKSDLAHAMRLLASELRAGSR